MAIQHPGGTIVSTTFTGGTKTAIVNALETQLTNAGWSVISGTGTGDVVMQSATTPTASNYIRVRLRDTSTNCASIVMQNTAATKVSQLYFLLPFAAKTFRIVANKYQFFCWVPGSTVAREYVGCGVPYIPSFLHGVINSEFGWINGNAESDTYSGTVRRSFRTSFHMSQGETQYWSGICNGNLCETNTSTHAAAALRLVIPYSAGVQRSSDGYRWHDDTLLVSDPLIAWGLANSTDESKIKGQLWGAMFVSDVYAGETAWTSVNSHDWIAVSNSVNGSTSEARGTLFLATT